MEILTKEFSSTLPLSVADRKHLMPYGAQKAVAVAEGVSEAVVSRIMDDDWHPKTPKGMNTLRRVQRALAKKLNRPVREVFAQAVA